MSRATRWLKQPVLDGRPGRRDRSVAGEPHQVEVADGVVAVDATLTVSDARALRRRLEAIGKPLLAVLLTQSHPDHYGGLVELVAGDGEVPIIAPPGVNEVIRRDDPRKEQILRPMFGDEWPRERSFPNRTIADGDSLSFGEATFTVIDLGPGESPHDSPWLLGDGRTVFLGDQIYDHMHCYLADGFFEPWLANIARLERDLPADAELLIGHGGPVDRPVFAWQRGYIETFVDAVSSADWSTPEDARASVVQTVTRYLPGEQLQFLMELSIDPVAAQLGLLAPVCR